MISIITPTYNREKLLKRLYNSLKHQTSKAFEWIVVDDGSKDNTKKLIEGFIDENIIKIKYIYQNNAGKHIAHNNGVLNSNGDLIICVDSDDYLEKNCVEYILKLWKNIKHDNNIIGIIQPRKSNEGHRMCSEFPNHIVNENFYNLVHKYNLTGDTALFFKSEILKNNLFKAFDDENFLTEISLYYKLDKFGKMYLSNEIFYIGEYQDDGLTSKYRRLMVNNPKGASYAYYICYVKSTDLKYKLKYGILVNGYLIEIEKNQRNFINKDIMLTILYPFGYLYNILKLKNDK